jgi:hypothetical protein
MAFQWIAIGFFAGMCFQALLQVTFLPTRSRAEDDD